MWVWVPPNVTIQHPFNSLGTSNRMVTIVLKQNTLEFLYFICCLCCEENNVVFLERAKSLWKICLLWNAKQSIRCFSSKKNSLKRCWVQKIGQKRESPNHCVFCINRFQNVACKLVSYTKPYFQGWLNCPEGTQQLQKDWRSAGLVVSRWKEVRSSYREKWKLVTQAT